MYIHFTYIYKYKMNLVIEESEQKTSNGGRKKKYIYFFLHLVCRTVKVT